LSPDQEQKPTQEPAGSDASGPNPAPSAAAPASREGAWSEIGDPAAGSQAGSAGGGKGGPAAPVAPLGDATHEPAPRRQRRAAKGRSIRIYVRVTEEEHTAIEARARAGGVSVPRLLVELATLGPAGATERNTMRTAVLYARRQIAGVANNLNQLAHWANAGQQLPPGFDKALADVERMERAVEDLRVAIEQGRGQR
jgi:hypothetical protein